jgi:mono/diheme cytochrome c family protein
MEPAQALANGIFSQAQVERGRSSFESECMDCHELEEFTGPDAYFEEQQGESLWSVFEFIWAEMPEDKPAWLEPEEYADILAFILSVYGFPAGDGDLPTDQRVLEQIELILPLRSG